MRACELQIQSKPLSEIQNLLAYLAAGELQHTKARTHLNQQKESILIRRILLSINWIWSPWLAARHWFHLPSLLLKRVPHHWKGWKGMGLKRALHNEWDERGWSTPGPKDKWPRSLWKHLLIYFWTVPGWRNASWASRGGTITSRKLGALLKCHVREGTNAFYLSLLEVPGKKTTKKSKKEQRKKKVNETNHLGCVKVWKKWESEKTPRKMPAPPDVNLIDNQSPEKGKAAGCTAILVISFNI